MPLTTVPDWAAPEDASTSGSSKTKAGGGAWTSLGVSSALQRSLHLRSFRNPTPIQRQCIPLALSTPAHDVLGMARTGSGKTLAYMIPLLSRLGAHRFGGPRALILCPNRELAMQILRVGKDLGRGMKKKKGKGKKKGEDGEEDEAAPEEEEEKEKEDLRWAIIMGGEGLDAQFEAIASGPDVIIATPGRFLHVVVEMDLDLRSIEMVIYDEADRLFELGFQTQLTEILHRLPSTRHSLLFSATLPTSLAEFAAAGLVNPQLVRLDADHRISPDLRLAFFEVKPGEKEAALLLLLREVVRVPVAESGYERRMRAEDAEEAEGDDHPRGFKGRGGFRGKGKRGPSANDAPVRDASRPQAIIFVATKHHVEFISTLLATSSYAVSSIYGSLDQVARKRQLDNFRHGITDLLVVTDVAARGLDIPVMTNVVNYDFPAGVRLFVHRVGRTARAGQKGTAWSIVARDDIPFVYDLETFLDRPIVDSQGEEPVYGAMPRESLDADAEHIRSSLEDAAPQLAALRDVMRKGEAMFLRSRAKASKDGYRKAKLHRALIVDLHPAFLAAAPATALTAIGEKNAMDVDARPDVAKERAEARKTEDRRKALLDTVMNFTPAETVFEIGARGKTEGAKLMKARRATQERRGKAAVERKKAKADVEDSAESAEDSQADDDDGMSVDEVVEKKKPAAVKRFTPSADKFRDPAFFMPHEKIETARDKGYSLSDGHLQSATLDLAADETGPGGARAQKASQLTWDRKHKKFVKDPGVGKDNKKMIRGESGVVLPASFRSGRYDEWRKKRGRGPLSAAGPGAPGADADGHRDDKRYRHKAQERKLDGHVQGAKPSRGGKGGFADDKPRRRRDPLDAGAGEGGADGNAAKGVQRSRPGSAGAKSGLLSADAVRKRRQLLEHRKAKNARKSKGAKGKGRR
ncbi:ATP-dependent RNA helicase dbp10 [Cryptotrichosporon argae]